MNTGSGFSGPSSHAVSLQSSESKDLGTGSAERCQTFSSKKDELINEYASGSTAYNTAEKNEEQCVNLKRGLRNLSFLKRYQVKKAYPTETTLGSAEITSS